MKAILKRQRFEVYLGIRHFETTEDAERYCVTRHSQRRCSNMSRVVVEMFGTVAL